MHSISMKHILAVDWWRKKIWLAWKDWAVDMIFPIGYIVNTESVYDDIAAIVVEKNISLILLGKPVLTDTHASSKQQSICDAIDAFGLALESHLPDSITICFVDEHYSSAMAGATLWDFTKHVWEDVVAAMKLLETC